METFIAHGGDKADLFELLDECRGEAGLEGLLCATRLFEDMYGGITFNFELKAPAAWELVNWKQSGLDQLVLASLKNPSSKNISLCINILSALACGITLQKLRPGFCEAQNIKRLDTLIGQHPELRSYARHKLIELVLSVDGDEEVLELLHSPSLMYGVSAQSKEVFGAVAMRWLATGEPLIKSYETLIEQKADDESAFQEFFEANPHILDPLAAEIWPQPNLRGALKPDYVIRRFDNSYVVVEIECPAKPLLTAGCQLAAPTTHAVAQAIEYRRFLERLPEVQTHFPGLDEVGCLVVVGLESVLSGSQQQALRNENLQRHGLQIVGFDWLAKRARSVRENLIRTGTAKRNVRVI